MGHMVLYKAHVSMGLSGSNLQQSAVTIGSVPAQGVAAVTDSAQVIAGQRALTDHQQMVCS